MVREERRQNPRVRTRFESLISLGRTEGVGVLADISYSGAQIEEVTTLPEVGDHVRLYVFVQPVSPFQIEGEVVRLSESGFAIACKDLDPQMCRLVDDAAAIVKVPR